MTVAKKAEMNTNTALTRRKGMTFMSRGKLRNGMNTLFVTVFTSAILAIFLMPFLYMTMTSLKTKAQITVLGSPIYPAKIPTFVFNGENAKTYTFKIHKGGILADQVVDMNKYAGKELEIFKVPLK